MGWNDDAVGLALAFYALWLATGLALVVLALRGGPRKAAPLAAICLVAQLLIAARAVQVNFAPLVIVSVAFAGCGALALRRLRRAG